MGIYIALLLVCAGIVGWVWGALKPHRRLWILIGVWPAVVFLLGALALYLWAVKPSIENNVEIGWPTLICIVLGLGAVISSPRPDPKDTHRDDSGASHA